jgi:hypothetical protein
MSAPQRFPDELKHKVYETVLAEITYAYTATTLRTRNVIMHSLLVRHLYAEPIDKSALCRLRTARSSVLHSSVPVETLRPWSVGVPTALPTCSPLWMDADHPDAPQRAIDLTVRSTVLAHNLSLVPKVLASTDASAAGFKEAKGIFQ